MLSRPLLIGSFPARVFYCLSFFVASILLTSQAGALPRTWIGGNVDWVDAGASTNWNPNDEPDSDDEAIFNTANAVNLGSNNAVNGLTLSGGIDLFISDFDLTVDGLVQAAGGGTNLFIGGAAGSVNADDVTINASGVIELTEGLLTLDEEVGVALIDINAGGDLIGNGTITFADVPGVATTVLVNDGELTALSRGLTIFTPPPVGTLQINTASGSFTRVDLDGAGEAGVVNVNRNQTLDLNVGFADAFNGTMNLFQESTFDSLNAWTLGAGGSIVANNGEIIGIPNVPAGTAFIAGGLLTQTGGTIDVVDTDGTLHFDNNFTMSGGTFTNSGTVIFDGTTTTITTAAGYAPAVSSAETIINGTMTITDAAGDFNWDGPGTATTTINGAGSLSLTVDQVDTGNDTYGGVLNLNDDADLAVNNTANSWTIANTLNKNNAGTSSVTGDRVIINGAVNANAGTLDMPAVTTTPSANISVTGTLTLGGGSEFGGATAISGTGTLLMEGVSTVSANTTVNVATFDWDGLGTGTNHTINAGVVFTINSATLDSDGDMDDPVNLAGSGSQLIVNGPTEWTATAAVNANNAGVGTATIGGTSRFILSGANADLNVNGNTNISAPLTLGTGSLVVIDGGFTLDANGATTYSGVVIEGAGTYIPAPTNTVTAFSTISPDVFDFDAGTWVVEPDATLTVNVTDYDASATNAFDGTITLNDGAINVTTSDAEFVMDGVLNMVSNNVSLAFAEWLGQPLDVGNDAGALDADVNVSGTFFSRISAPVDFNSDADVNIDGVALLLNSTVNFDTVNGANNAEFTGDGFLRFGGVVNVNEAVTINMVGGVVDLDGSDTVGDFVNIDAPMTINAATMENFGRVNSGGGVNTLDVNNSVGTGVLTVNLDDPNAEWTLNGPGVMNLVNDNVEATLLAGNDVNVNGTVNVTGDVRTTARLDIAGVVNINTAAQPLRLAGGNDSNDLNTLAGGTISGAGILAANTGKGLQGFGTINTAIDFDGTSDIVAAGGTLTYTNFITDVNTIRTSGAAAVFNFTQPVTTNVTDDGILMEGGTIQGAQLTVAANIKPLRGTGTVTNQVINNGVIAAVGGNLLLQTAGNNNDWDGVGNVGELEAVSGDLEMIDTTNPVVPPVRSFGGSVRAINDNRVFANGFALDFLPGSSLELEDEATYRASSSTDIGGTVTIGAGADATIQVANNFFLTFETGSTTTLNGDVTLINNNIIIEDGATFSGAGAIIVPDGSHMVAKNLADIGVLLDMQGALRPGNSEGIGRVDLFDYQQSNTGELFVELTGTSLNAFDRLVASGDVVLDGYLNIDIDDLFVPALGNTFNIITGNTVTGEFGFADVSGMPAGLAFHIEYLANAVQLQVVNKPIFSADFDDDGDVDPTDLFIWKNAFNLNQLGDADGDNDSDGADFLLWQQQFGSAPAVAVVQPAAGAVPEPSAAALLLIATAVAACRRSRC